MSIYKSLIKHRLVNRKEIIKIADRTRDNKSAKVFQDTKTKIVFLKKNLLKKNYYPSVNQIIGKYALEDASRRLKDFESILKNKDILDVGFGDGSFLIKNKISKSKSGVELNIQHLNKMRRYKNITVYDHIDIKNKTFDVITMFHVLEHLDNQNDYLKKIKLLMKKKSKLIIEVPHAKDYLILEKNTQFLKHTLWCEHLILHTKKSLEKFFQLAGFTKIKIYNFQRYNFNNHLNWMVRGKPFGHVAYKVIKDKEKLKAYNDILIEYDITDTLIAEISI